MILLAISRVVPHLIAEPYAFHASLVDYLTNATPMSVTATQSRDVVAIMQAAEESALAKWNPSYSGANSHMRIRWGFLGASWVAKTALVPAVKNATNATLQAVASRDPKRSAAFEPTTVHNSYDDLLADPNVDAVYISLANHLHCEWATQSLKRRQTCAV